jgi:hypothetical protein
MFSLDAVAAAEGQAAAAPPDTRQAVSYDDL